MLSLVIGSIIFGALLVIAIILHIPKPKAKPKLSNENIQAIIKGFMYNVLIYSDKELLKDKSNLFDILAEGAIYMKTKIEKNNIDFDIYDISMYVIDCFVRTGRCTIEEAAHCFYPDDEFNYNLFLVQMKAQMDIATLLDGQNI